MPVSVGGLVINGVMLVVILVIVVFLVLFYRDEQECLTQQSPYCYTIACPCDSGPPCAGYARRPGPRAGTWYCSDAPLSLVNDDGSLA